MNIVTVFAGREPNLKILVKYLQKALELKMIDEVHLWNNTRNSHDEFYLKSISNLKRISSTSNYVEITPEIIDNSFEININKAHIKISQIDELNQNNIEIILDSTKSIIVQNNVEILEFQPLTENIKISIKDHLCIYKNNELIVDHPIDYFEIKKVEIKSTVSVDINYKTTQNHKFYFMDTCEKSWKNYYQYYDNPKYVDDIILKCDDDIVFIDLNKLPKFIEFVKNNDYDLVLANTINNGVSAYFQQNRYNLIPKSLMTLEYPHNGFCGTLWESGQKAEILHNYFIQNYEKFLIDRNESIQINTRFSINFFGYKGKNWHKIKDCYEQDEHNLTVDYVENRKFKNIFYSDFYVSHLSFFRQNETGINLYDLVIKYDEFYDRFMNDIQIEILNQKQIEN